MLIFLTLGVMAAVAYASLREGVLTAISTLVNVVLSGVVAFNFYEPIAGELEKMFKGTFLNGLEDGLTLIALFAGCLGLLRVITNNLANSEIELPALAQQVGGVVVSLVTGYLIAGILVCIFQTLPWDENFMGFEPGADPNASRLRSYLPPDRAWLAVMHRASLQQLSQDGSAAFDPEATFEMRYLRGRRYKEAATAGQ